MVSIMSLSMAVACLSCGQPDSADMSKYLQANGNLAERLVIQDAQAGVVGKAGTEIVIEPSGEWTKTQFWGEQRRKELARGKLTPDEIANLARTLAKQRTNQLPREFGKTDATANPNPHHLMLRFGNERSELLLPPKMDVKDFVQTASEDEQAPARRLDAVIAEVKKLVGEAR
jgi:hypothetical protein